MIWVSGRGEMVLLVCFSKKAVRYVSHCPGVSL